MSSRSSPAKRRRRRRRPRVERRLHGAGALTATRPQLVRDVLLRDGTTLRLRAPGPEDFADIKRFYDALSEESRYMRFHGYSRTDLPARQYAEADGVDRVALIGHSEGRIVAAAGYDCLREPGAAEVAFAVADDFQSKGAATRLLEQLAEIASDRGLRRFDAEVLAENAKMLGVFRRAGFALRRRSAFGELTVSLDIRPDPEVLARIDARTHRAAVASLQALFAPRSVAVVGAHPHAEDPASAIVARVIAGGFTGVVAPVNPDAAPVCAIRAVRCLADLPEAPELVVTTLPLDDVVRVAREAAEAGAKGLLALAAPDPGDEPVAGSAAHEELLEIVRTAGMRLIGPHSLGLLNTDPELSLHVTVARPARAGRLAIASQSGAVGVGLLGHADARGLGISTFAALGDRIDVSTNDLLEFWEEDERTAAIMVYLETFGNPERFVRVARRVARRKPILAVKGNRTPEARRLVAESHTAAAMQGDAAIDAMLTEAGVLRFRGGEELFNAALFFESQPLPDGRRVGIVSNSAGVATLAVDACATRGLTLGEVGAGTLDLPVRHPSGADVRGLANPAILPSAVTPAGFAEVVRALLGDPGIDAVMAYYVDAFADRPEMVMDAVAGVAAGVAKPVVTSVLAADGRLPDRSSRKVPNFLFPEACAAVLGTAAGRREWLARPLGQRPDLADVDPEAARAVVDAHGPADGDAASAWLASHDAEELLAAYGIPVTTMRACADLGAAIAAASEVGGPVVLKADCVPPRHASDIDAVLLGLQGEDAVRAGWHELERRVARVGWTWQGAVVEPLVEAGADLLIGTVKDPDYGAVMALGLGGRQAGLGADATVRLPPATDVEADELIDAAPGVARRLGEFRGQSALDRAALRDVLLRFARLLHDVPEVLEADLNPTRWMEEGCVVLDARVRVGRVPARARVKTW